MTEENRAGEVDLEYRVPYADTDQMGVVYYANYFVYFERLRNELFRGLGRAYAAIEEEGLYLPVAEAQAEYLRPARYDDVLNIKGWFSWVQGSRIRIEYEILREGELLTIGSTIHATISREGAPRRAPTLIREFLDGFR